MLVSFSSGWLYSHTVAKDSQFIRSHCIETHKPDLNHKHLDTPSPSQAGCTATPWQGTHSSSGAIALRLTSLISITNTSTIPHPLRLAVQPHRGQGLTVHERVLHRDQASLWAIRLHFRKHGPVQATEVRKGCGGVQRRLGKVTFWVD